MRSKNHVPVLSNLGFSLRCCIHLVLDSVRSACVQQRVLAVDRDIQIIGDLALGRSSTLQCYCNESDSVDSFRELQESCP